MHYKTLFRVMLKVLGVYFVVHGLLTTASGVSQVVVFWIENTGFGSSSWMLSTSVYGIIESLVGLYLFYGGRRIANLAIPSNRVYCASCSYELDPKARGRCPECGEVSDDPRVRKTDQSA